MSIEVLLFYLAVSCSLPENYSAEYKKNPSCTCRKDSCVVDIYSI